MSDDPRDAAWLAGKRVAEIDRLEAIFRGGNLKALKRAVELCGRYDMPLLPWVRHAVLARLDEAPRPKGTPTKMDVHVIRWDAVCELRERREELKDPPIGCKTEGYKPTREAAFENASEVLRGTDAQGSPGAVEASYKLVQRRIKRGWRPVF